MGNQITGNHCVAIFGGAVAGSEAAYQLSLKGFKVVVFDQSRLPYGKLEDGLPKWHHKLRDQEEQKIDEKINRPDIWFVPGVKLGRDISFDEVLKWGFSAIILATGAWRDRPLPIEDIDRYVGKGLYYQNPFVIWFNHHHQPDYQGPVHEIKDNAIVIGGGLASLDVVKILMLETVSEALRKRGISTNLFELEKKGIDKTLASLNLSMEDLGLKGCTLYYRRRAIDMPLSPMSTATSQQLAKVQLVRQKILDNFQKKYLFRFIPCCIPVNKKTQGDHLTGITFQKTIIENGRLIPVKGNLLEAETPLAISSIGSIPEPIEGIPSQEGVFPIADPGTCLIDGFDHVFAIGNAVTGKGNINESIKHSREVSTGIIDHFFEWQQQEYQDWHRQTALKVDQNIGQIINRIEKRPSLSDELLQSILEKTRVFQQKAGFDGNYDKWIKKNLPIRYEEIAAPSGSGLPGDA